jgi:hypothetical protein
MTLRPGQRPSLAPQASYALLIARLLGANRKGLAGESQAGCSPFHFVLA